MVMESAKPTTANSSIALISFINSDAALPASSIGSPIILPLVSRTRTTPIGS
ncbi:unnamed protein product, partial [marine sediment metagenome]